RHRRPDDALFAARPDQRDRGVAHPRPMRRRDLLGVAATTAALSVSAASLAQRQAGTKEAMNPDLERFNQRLDLIRQSVNIPGMSVGVFREQSPIYARGFGVVDIVRGTEARLDTPYRLPRSQSRSPRR